MEYLHQTAARSVIISVNPKAGARSGQVAVDALESWLKERGFRVQVLSDIEQVAATATALSQTGDLRCVVSAGGDGTIALIANHTPPSTPLAVLPLGTENLLSKYLELPTAPARLGEIIESGVSIDLDAGQAGERVFLLMLGCGFDAEVVRRLHAERTGHIHHLSYAKPILDSIRSYQYPELRVYCDSAETPITARWVFVVNLPRYAGGLQFAPAAVGTDGLLDVCTFRDGSLLSGLRYLTGIVLGQHTSWEECVTIRAKRLRIEASEPVPFQMDGDPGGFLPVEVQVLPARLRLLVPKSWAVGQGFVSLDSQSEKG